MWAYEWHECFSNWLIVCGSGITLEQALTEWAAWFRQIREQYNDSPCWMAAHSGNDFDLPVLFQQERTVLDQTPGTFLKNVSNYCAQAHILAMFWSWFIFSVGRYYCRR